MTDLLVKVPRGSTPKAIIEAAERLFGTFGIEAVTLRQINAAAKVSNNSAVHYHFGDKSQLVQAIWDYRLPQVEELRVRYLRELVERGEQHALKPLLRAMISPICDITDEDGVRLYAAFFRNTLRWSSPIATRWHERNMTASGMTAIELFIRHVPDLSREKVFRRLTFAIGMFLDMMIFYDRGDLLGAEALSREAIFDEGLDIAAGACLGGAHVLAGTAVPPSR